MCSMSKCLQMSGRTYNGFLLCCLFKFRAISTTKANILIAIAATVYED
jgi:hypothetical protein